MFSSPQWGSFLSTVLGRYASGQSKPSFRPLNGVLFYLQVALTTIDNPFDPFSSPQRGSFLSTSSLETPKKAWDGFRPLNGVLFYLPCKNCSTLNFTNLFSSPQRGSFLSTSTVEVCLLLQTNCFRPLNGVLFYLRFEKVCISSTGFCFRPLNGVLFYLPSSSQMEKLQHIKVFVPSTGFFSIYPASRSPLNLVVSRRVCGRNRIHLRNLSKK